MESCFILVPIISGFIAWLTIILSLRIVRYQLYKHQSEWANQLANAALTELLPLQEIIGGLGAVDVSDKLDALLSVRVQAVLNRFKESTPMVGMFLNDTVSTKIKTMVVEEITKEWPELQKSMTTAVLERFDLRDIITTKLRSIEPETIERALKLFLGQRWQQLQWLAAGWGSMLGLLQAALAMWCYSK